VSNKHNLENSVAFSPTNSPAMPLDAELVVRREAPGGLAEQAPLDEQTLSRCCLAPLFADIMCKGQISLSDWRELMTAPWDNSFTSNDEAILMRLIYGVHRGLVKVVE
jgi:hypothetical protein